MNPAAITAADLRHVLRCLEPEVVARLGTLSGAMLPEIQVALQVEPIEDRFILARHGMITLDDTPGLPPAEIKEVHILILDLIAEAAIVCGEVALMHPSEITDYLTL